MSDNPRSQLTHREQIIAEIHRPVSTSSEKISRWESFLNLEERRGKLRRATPSAPPLANLRKTKELPVKIDLQVLLDDVKADRY